MVFGLFVLVKLLEGIILEGRDGQLGHVTFDHIETPLKNWL